MEQIKTRKLFHFMVIIDGLANLIIWNPFDDYLLRCIEGLRNSAYDNHSMSIGRRGKAL